MQEAIFSWERREELARLEGIQLGRQKGIEQEIQQVVRQIAKKMLAKEMEIGTICDLTGLTLDQVEQLRNELN